MTRLRFTVWLVAAAVVVLATRTIVYALAPQSVLLAALAHDRAGPDLTVPLIGGVVAAVAAAAAALWLAAAAVRERLLLEGRRVVAVPRLRPTLLAGRAVAFFFSTSFAFAMVESTIHWRAGLGWHGLHCLTGPVHRDAIPVLAALSLLAVAVHGAVEHLLAWARRLFAQLAVRIFRRAGAVPRFSHSGILRPSTAPDSNGPRGPPALHRPCPCISL